MQRKINPVSFLSTLSISLAAVLITSTIATSHAGKSKAISKKEDCMKALCVCNNGAQGRTNFKDNALLGGWTSCHAACKKNGGEKLGKSKCLKYLSVHKKAKDIIRNFRIN